MRFTFFSVLLSFSILLLLSSFSASAATSHKVDILVLSTNHQSVPNVGISLIPINIPKTGYATAPEPQVVHQIDTQFSPHILMAQMGAEISFPNADNVKHHVYSFSEAKKFELRLYKEEKPEPIPFDKAGTVTLGCNIHDWMLGYVYVVDTPYFAKTNESGFVQLELPAGDYELRLHNPLLQFEDSEFVKVVKVSGTQNITMSLKQPLLRATDGFDEGDEFDAY
ncbi:methylamine utilization protein [Psychrosphaera haliotis]|nr:methylamine utilization protein [Psychrosphaera haliotis]